MNRYTIPSAITPFSDESFPGLVMRYGDRYRLRDPRRLFDRIKPPNMTLWRLCSVDPSTHLGRDIKTVTGMDDATFARASLWHPDQHQNSILGQKVWRELVLAERRACCPLCLQDSTHHRAVWLIHSMPVCAVHGAWLRDHCHQCRKPYEWRGHNTYRCANQRCLADIRNAPVEYLEPEKMRGIAGLHRILHADDPTAETPFGMPFGTLLETCFTTWQVGARP